MSPVKISTLMKYGIILLFLSACNAPATQLPPSATPLPIQPSPTSVASFTPTSPPTEMTVRETPTLEPSLTPITLPPELDRNDIAAVIAWFTYVVNHRQATEITRVIGDHGTAFAPYAVGANPVGRNNGDEIAAILAEALASSEPVCLGYDPNFGTLPDKAILVFEGIDFPWSQQGQLEGSQFSGFQFFKFEGGWELVFITPIPEMLMPPSLIACPN